MLVRVNFGWKAGEIQDIEPVAALQMVADGRASLPNYEAEAKPDPTIGSAVDVAESQKPKAENQKTQKRPR